MSFNETEADAGSPNDQAGQITNSRVADERSLLMALKYGIGTVDPVLPGLESVDDWVEHRDCVIRDIDPVGAIESAYAQRAAMYLWRLERVARYKNNEARSDGLVATQASDVSIDDPARSQSGDATIRDESRQNQERSKRDARPTSETIDKYEAHLKRMLAQTMAELKRLRKDRRERMRRSDAESKKIDRPSETIASIPIERFRKQAPSSANSPNAVETPADPADSSAPDAFSDPIITDKHNTDK
jgi:hypothetical protein